MSTVIENKKNLKILGIEYKSVYKLTLKPVFLNEVFPYNSSPAIFSLL